MKNKGKLFQDEHLRNSFNVFSGRKEAGLFLGKMLKKNLIIDKGIILAIPNGGIPVGAEIAKQLALPFDCLIVRKIQIPDNPEAGFGAIGPDYEVIINEDIITKLKLSQEEIDNQIRKTKEVLRKRDKLFRGERPFPLLQDLIVILVDDGLASGYTMLEAVHFVKRKGAKKVIIAVPTAPLGTIEKIILEVDEIYCPNIRDFYPFAVADAYINWYDLADWEVLKILDEIKTLLPT